MDEIEEIKSKILTEIGGLKTKINTVLAVLQEEGEQSEAALAFKIGKAIEVLKK